MEQNSQPYDLANLPHFMATGPLIYDLNEIEHQFYMFDHRCVGCVVLMCTKPVDAGVMGRVTLSGKALEGCFWLPLTLPQVGQALSLVVPVRGLVDYDSHYTLRLEGFKDGDGATIEPLEMPLTTRPRPVQDPACAQHDEIALEAARQGMVLLKNKDNVLPLPGDATLNLFGEGVTNFRMGATGAGRINPRFCHSLRDAVAQTSSFTLNSELDALYAVPSSAAPATDVLARAKALCDTAIILITRGTGENIDNNPLPGEYYLSADEEAMVKAICEVFEKTVVVLNTGYPIDMRWIESYDIKGLVYAGLAGQAGAQALCEILDGRTNPSGKLPDTWAWDYFDIPASANFLTRQADEKPIMADDDVWVDTCYEEGIYVGYRYFESFAKDVAFPFGHGLSYTSFAMQAQPPVASGAGWQLSVTVKNTGTAAGREVAMLYAALPGTTQEQPARQLVAFGKTALLAPGQAETLTLDIKEKTLATFSEGQSAWLLEKGTFRFYLGGSVRAAAQCGSIEMPEEKIISTARHKLPCPVAFKEMSADGLHWPIGGLTRIRKGARTLADTLPRSWPPPAEPAAEKPAQPITYAELKTSPELLDAFVAQMSTAELARLNMMYGHGWSMDAKGEAGRLAPLPQYRLPGYVCADGNCGVNVHQPNIGMPTSVVVCATFSPALARQVGRVIGEEAAENEIQMILAPAMNIHRNPLCGRHAEYFSEDPLLAGVMAAAQVQGLHDAGVSDSVKHVVANNCETARKRNHSLVGQRALRELYLRAFEVLCDHVKPDSIMTGYNALNGCMCGSDPVLIEGIFREELGFDGFTMTDWNSYDTVDMVQAVNAGISWLTPGENDGSRVAVLEKAVADGKLPRTRLAENARRVFAIMLRRFA